jgi:hypothetical protein
MRGHATGAQRESLGTRTNVTFVRGVARAGRHGLVGIAVAVALAAVGVVAGPAAARPRVVETFSVSASATVPANGTKALTLTCPRAAVALNGAPTTAGAYDSVPGTANPRRWTVRFAAQAFPRNVAAVERCVRLRLPKGVDGVGLVVGTRWSQRLSVPPGMTTGIGLKCDRGQAPTGWGIERGTSPEAQALGVVQAAPTKHGYSFKVKNPGPTEAGAILHVRCLQKLARGTNHTKLTFQTRVASFSGAAQSLTAGSCRRKEFSVSTGASLDPVADVLLSRSYPAGQRGGQWSFSGTGVGAPAATSLVCLSTATQFR